MKLSARERTGLRAMVELARHHGDGPVSLNEVARIEGLPYRYLEQIAGSLRRAGLLESVRGAHGGYLLARVPTDISIGDILRAVEGSLMSVDCIGTDGSCCIREPVCATKAVYQIVFDRLSETLDHTSLADIVACESQSAEIPERIDKQ